MRALAPGAASLLAPHSLAPVALAAACLAVATLLAALPLGAAAGLAAGLVILTLALIEPLVALAVLLASIPLSTELTLETGDFAVTAVEPLFVLLVLSWLGGALVRRELTLHGGPLLAAFGLVVLATFASSLAAARLGLAIKEIAKWVELSVVLAFGAGALRTEGRRRAILAVLFSVAALEALYGIYQYATGRGPAAFAVGEALRAYGHFEQPNPFAGYLGTILPLAVALALAGRQAGLRLLAGLTALLLGAAILLSLSRGAWVGVVLALVLMLAAWGPRSRGVIPPLLGAAALLVLLTAANALPGAWADRLVAVAANFGVFDVRTVEVTPENFAVVERMAHWQAGWGMFLEQPWLGVGAGNYPARYEEYMLPGWREPLGHAHNYYLNMAAEAGLAGLLALLGALATVFATIGRGLRAGATGERRALLVGLLGSFTVLVIHNLFDNLLVHGMAVQIGALAGLLAAVSGPSAPPERPGAAAS